MRIYCLADSKALNSGGMGEQVSKSRHKSKMKKAVQKRTIYDSKVLFLVVIESYSQQRPGMTSM